ncbi:uncharacterized protein BDV14DRAFT_209024 [Aspergillus stella-maris]|uniref:uncharacterized protein n=1 Tax=Aspergillus stella-maris TaxID=1810926 RepID=UPI003CCDD5F6
MSPATLIQDLFPSPSTITIPRPAPKVTPPKQQKAQHPTTPIPQSLLERSRLPPSKKRPFNASEHLIYEPPSKIHKMADFGLEGAGISPNAISEPFPLFSEDAIAQMRSEVFSEEVMEHCRFKSDFCENMVRGMGHRRAPFTYSVFKSPDALSRISEVAGVDLIPAWDYEIANVNIAVQDDPVDADMTQLDDSLTKDNANGETSVFTRPTTEDNTPAFAWHYDSFPFVCVTMLSDCAGMVGGETAIKLPCGKTKKVRGPAMGYAVIMQGRYLEHQALKAAGGRERITLVTPFRPRDPLVTDEIVLAGVRCNSHLDEMYPQYFEYRLEVLEERIRAMRREEIKRSVRGDKFDVQGRRAWLRVQWGFIGSMLEEMVVVQ